MSDDAKVDAVPFSWRDIACILGILVFSNTLMAIGAAAMCAWFVVLPTIGLLWCLGWIQ